jgi:hypothetical protein
MQRGQPPSLVTPGQYLPTRATRGRIARSGGPVAEEILLALVAREGAATDPARAESIARSIISKSCNATGLAMVAKVVAARDPDRADRLLSDTESLVRAIRDGAFKVSVLAELAEAWTTREDAVAMYSAVILFV